MNRSLSQLTFAAALAMLALAAPSSAGAALAAAVAGVEAAGAGVDCTIAGEAGAGAAGAATTGGAGGCDATGACCGGGDFCCADAGDASDSKASATITTWFARRFNAFISGPSDESDRDRYGQFDRFRVISPKPFHSLHRSIKFEHRLRA